MSPGRARRGDPRRFTGADSGRLPVLAIGSNAAPEALERKFAHFAERRTAPCSP